MIAGIVSCTKRRLELWYDVIDLGVFKIIHLAGASVLEQSQKNQGAVRTLIQEKK